MADDTLCQLACSKSTRTCDGKMQRDVMGGFQAAMHMHLIRSSIVTQQGVYASF